MKKILKIDFHTHPVEALKDSMGIKGIGNINQEIARKIVKSIKSAGLDGIALTEHNNFNHSWVACLQIREYFRKENLVLIPGTEIDNGDRRLLQLYIPDNYRRHIPFFNNKEWFYILARPEYHSPVNNEYLEQYLFDAVEEINLHGEYPVAESISRERKVPLIRSSDAHKLEDIGRIYMEIEAR